MGEVSQSPIDADAPAELAPRDPHPERAPAAAPELREYLPGLEPERQITDWGRSERVEQVVDRTLYQFLYHYWFRVQVEGIANVPADGPALLVANHAGVLPPDAAMIGKAIREEHRRPRPVHFITERPLSRIPGLDMLRVKVGAVSAHPANLHRLLFDERQLVLMFPEGAAATAKPLKERYRLRRFARAMAIESALQARAQIVPVAVVGSEEAAPMLARIGVPRVWRRLPHLPLAPALPLPAKFRIRFLEPLDTEALGAEPWRDRGLVQALGEDMRALIQANLLEMIAERRSVWLG